MIRRPEHLSDPMHIADRYPVLDWHAIWDTHPEGPDWLVDPLFERGRIYAVYAPAKAGKSLLLQDIAAGLAAGRPVLGNPALAPVRILYVDLENNVSDVVARMRDYGHTPDTLANLRYLSFPNLPALDSQAGGQHLVTLARYHQPELVIIDTVSRVIAGKENESDTFHALYRYALAPLKAHGVGIVRLDHGGKDVDRGQRGSSAKATDVDTVWRLEAAGSRLTLHRVAARTANHPEQVVLQRRTGPLRHVLESAGDAAEPELEGTTEIVQTLTVLGVPLDAGRVLCRKALTDAGVACSSDTLRAAIRLRRLG